MLKAVRASILTVGVIAAGCLAAPAVVQAQNSDYHPADFTQPLTVSRGTLAPQAGQNGVYLSHDETCTLVVKEFGWERAACDGLEFYIGSPTADIDNMLVRKPVSDGYVKLDDWKSSDASEQIDGITDSYKESIAAQSKNTGKKIEFVGWKLYPTVDEQKSIMYYAASATWDGEPSLNISLSIFDRKGYVEIDIVPVAADISKEAIDKIVHDVAGMYKPAAGTAYYEFSPGDQIAGYGALGVLAGLLGVKYGGAAAAGFVAVGLVLLKKLWFIIILPIAALGRVFRRRKQPGA